MMIFRLWRLFGCSGFWLLILVLLCLLALLNLVAAH